MTHSSLTPKTAYAAVLACLTVANFGCFGEFDQASEGDQAAQTLSAKKTESWTPPGLDAQGKLVGPWNAADPMISATMTYEWHGFDLESGSVYESQPGDPFALQQSPSPPAMGVAATSRASHTIRIRESRPIAVDLP